MNFPRLLDLLQNFSGKKNINGVLGNSFNLSQAKYLLLLSQNLIEERREQERERNGISVILCIYLSYRRIKDWDITILMLEPLALSLYSVLGKDCNDIS